jgi:hypothetical protein
VVQFQDQVAILWKDAFQQWVIGSDQLSHQLVRSMVGAGCVARQSVASAGDDLMMLGSGGTVTGFRAATITLAPEASTLGAEIEDATRPLWIAGATIPVGAYWPRLGLYVLAFGQEAYVLSLVPGSKTVGWSRWTLPFAVNAMCAAGGELWVRSGNNLYSFDDAGNNDDGTAVPVRVETAEIDAGTSAKMEWYGVSANQDTLMQVVREGRPARGGNGGIDPAMGFSVLMPGRSPQWAYAVSSYHGDSFALRIGRSAAEPGYSIDAVGFDLKRLRGGKGVR